MKAHIQTQANLDLLYWPQLQGRNELGLKKLIERYFNALQNYGYKFVRDEDFVKDCVQEFLSKSGAVGHVSVRRKVCGLIYWVPCGNACYGRGFGNVAIGTKKPPISKTI
ncbi:hypothetical protein [Spirosoma sp.]|uniref:hypothetical protein n=1 Tax=Spirosoma sp. TaxID=1899569 RepID=UPI003B3A2343